MGGLVNLVCKISKILWWLAKNTKKKELGTSHHNDASSTGYLITVTLHQYILKAMFLSTHVLSTLIKFILIMKKGYKQVNEKRFLTKSKGCRDVCLVMKKSTTGPQCTQTRG